ncbi:keratin, type I cytoskeletal 18 [Callorhinchus milii]|uniref:keratin, type I cytoskeletal 18 n=1 Tax=Callorhinchus milii TaxID=7868 RepID=UPI001C3F6757|nr:keratin, type I cytoskeletal 18 [Callorhinchus milii]
MQNLNNRLASYLSQVKSLESSNLTLAAKIKEFSKPKTLGGFDWSLYDTRVKALLKQIEDLFCGNARLAMELDSSKHRAENFGIKSQCEVEMSLSVAADIESLRALKTQYLNLATQMESEISSLEADIAQLKEDHEKEKLSLLREQKGLNVHVGVSSAPAADLNKMLSDVRAEYEAMVRKQQEQTEAWYQKQLETEEHRTSDGGEGMEAMKAEMMGYQRQVQTLRSELDSTAGANQSLADSLLKVELRYKEELSRYQRALSGLERELIELRNGTGQQSRQYQELLHIKSKLEAEISTYRGLLDTAGSGKMVQSSGGEKRSTISSDLKAETKAERATETKTVIRRVITTETIYPDDADPISKSVIVTGPLARSETGDWTLTDAKTTSNTKPDIPTYHEGITGASLVAKTTKETHTHIQLEPQIKTLETIQTCFETQPETLQTQQAPEISRQTQRETQVETIVSRVLTLPDIQMESLEVPFDKPSDIQLVRMEAQYDMTRDTQTVTLSDAQTVTLL